MNPVVPMGALLSFFVLVAPISSQAAENSSGHISSNDLALPPRLECGKPKSPTAKSICADITVKYRECVEYNKRLGNDYDCGSDKQLLDWRALAGSAEDKHAQVNMPGVRIGMTKKQVIEKTHWGSPTKINTTVLSGSITEQWVYESGHYIYFENGRVKAIQTSQ